ncbi:MAG: lysophospholipid acyltransferase family protein [bacterium]
MKFSQKFYDRAYTVLWETYWVLFKILFRWKVYGLEHIPLTGGAILAVNHASALDPLLGGDGLPRKIWYLGRASLIKNRFIDFIMKCQHMIPIRRGEADLGAMKRVIGLIRSGEIVLMFPEGTRSVDEIRVAYGPVIRYEEFSDCPKGREGLVCISAKIMERIAALKRQLEG